MKVKLIITQLSIIVLFSACEKDAVISEKKYPQIVTTDVSDISDSSLVFNGYIAGTGKTDSIEYGFIWDTKEPDIETSNKVSFQSKKFTGEISFDVKYGLVKDEKHYVRTFLKAGYALAYGNIIEFTPNGNCPAEITNTSITEGFPGEKIEIYGKNWGNDIEKVRLFFGDHEAKIESMTHFKITTYVPIAPQETECDIVIQSYGNTFQYPKKFTILGNFKKLADLPSVGRENMASFTINGKGYVCLGKRINNEYTNEIFMYDPIENTWQKKAFFPGTPRSHTIGFSILGKGYIGFGVNGNTFFNDLWEYDPVSDNWTQIISESEYYGAANACFVINNTCYILTTTKFISFSPLTGNSFIPIGSTPFQYRIQSSGLTFDNHGYVIFGKRNEIPSNKFYCFNVETLSWEEKLEMPGKQRYSGTIFSIQDKIYAGLGYAGHTAFSNIYEYCPETNSWQKEFNFQGPLRFNPVYFVIDNKMYFGTGRINNRYFINDFWEFDPDKYR